MRTLEDFIRPTQKELFNLMRRTYEGLTISRKGEFVLVKGEAPIMLLAHMDTVHKERVKQICKTENGNVLMSPQGIGGDDRCGVYALNTVYSLAPVKPWLLFLCDEEIGCVGAGKFARRFEKSLLPEKLKEVKCLIEIDRKGSKDAVYYDYANDDFEDYITSKGFKTAFGSCSDISYVAPAMGVAAVNLSSGYYNQHTQHEYIVSSEIDETSRKVLDIVADSVKPDFPRYEYREKFSSHGFFGRSWYEDDWYDSWGGNYTEKEIEKLVPEGIREQYKELLDLYVMDELESWRAAYGDEVIGALYRAEFICDPDADNELNKILNDSQK